MVQNENFSLPMPACPSLSQVMVLGIAKQKCIVSKQAALQFVEGLGFGVFLVLFWRILGGGRPWGRSNIRKATGKNRKFI